MGKIELRAFTEQEYHSFFRHYVPDTSMTYEPFTYNQEMISRSWHYNYGGYQENYAHYGIFWEGRAVGAFQLKRIDKVKGTCEFGIILQNDRVKNLGIGTEAIQEGIRIARKQFGISTVIGDTSGRNARMNHIFEKLGFIRIETVNHAFELPDGSYDSRIVYRKNLTEETGK